MSCRVIADGTVDVIAGDDVDARRRMATDGEARLEAVADEHLQPVGRNISVEGVGPDLPGLGRD